MLVQQPSMMGSVAETSSDEEQQLNGIAIGFRERQNSTVGQRRYTVDEQTKIQLAIQVSQVTLPGASTEQSDSRYKPSGAQLVHMGHLRRMQKSRITEENRLEDRLMEPIASSEELIDFQGRMHDFRNMENQRANVEDEVLGKQNKRRFAWFVIGLIVVAVVTAVAVGVLGGLLGGSSEAIDADETSLFHDCYMYNDTHPSDRFLQLRNLVASAGAWEHSPIDAAGSSQRAALCWLSDFDSFELEFVEGIEEYEVLQRFALAVTYYHFVGTTPETRTQKLSGSNWLENEHVCEWDFVVCDYPSNRVAELFLDGIDLTRPIPQEVALMSDLVCLKLTRCQLTGQIPSTLSRLTQLQELDLRYNALMNTIPSELGLLTELKTLNLGQNQLQGEIPPQLFDNSNLLDLVLKYNYFTGMLPSALSTQTGLTSLSVERNSLTGTIPDISRLKCLTYLALGSNEIEGSFPDISRMRKLESLQLVYMGLSGSIPSSLWFLTSLVTLNLSFASYVTGTIPAAVGLLTNLETLSLRSTKMSGSLPTTLGNLYKLRLINLDNLVGLTGTIPTEFGRLSSLRSLTLPRESHLSGSFPGEVCNLRSQGAQVYQGDAQVYQGNDGLAHYTCPHVNQCD